MSLERLKGAVPDVGVALAYPDVHRGPLSVLLCGGTPQGPIPALILLLGFVPDDSTLAMGVRCYS